MRVAPVGVRRMGENPVENTRGPGLGCCRLLTRTRGIMTETALCPEVRGKGGNWQEWEIKGTSEASKTPTDRKATPRAEQSRERETRLGLAGCCNHGSWAVDRVLLHTPPGSSQPLLWFSEAPQVHGGPSHKPAAQCSGQKRTELSALTVPRPAMLTEAPSPGFTR